MKVMEEKGTMEQQQAADRLDHVRRTLWMTRGDVRAACGDDALRFDLWMLTDGRREYETLADPDVAGLLLTRLLAPAEPSQVVVGIPLPGLAVAIWHLRPDLRALFDISTDGGRAGLLVWLLGDGLRDLGVDSPASRIDLSILWQPVALAGDPLPVTRLMWLLWTGRPDLQAAFDLSTPQGCQGLRHWFYIHGLLETRMAGLLDPVRAAELTARLPLIFWQAESGQAHTPPAEELAAWLAGGAADRYPILRHLAGITDMAAPAIARAPARLRTDGVNLIGHAQGEFGVGQDVREAARALDAAGIPCAIFDLPAGEDIGRGDTFLNDRIGQDLPFATNLFCMTGMETARLHATRGDRIFTGRRNIGFWPWELAQWPAVWNHALGLVDEVWASSRHSYGAYRAATDRIVRHMPMAVTVEGVGAGRTGLGLPEGRFLFLFAFDGLSGMARKNPLACLDAFARAFPRGDEPVGLVVKAMRAATSDAGLTATLAAHARRDPRIILVDRTLPRAAMLSLIREADCFLSLHRAEGFGRGIAEAMLLGRPVIVTGYSGNMDFTVPGTAALVDHRLRPVAAGEYPDATGMEWAEPDIEHAAWWMRRLTAETELRRQFIVQGRALVTTAYAPKTVGTAYRAILPLS